jgi:large subunit ribosomal protein L25
VPGAFVYDITDLQIGDVVRAGELTMPEGVELVDDPEMAIVTALAARAEEIPEPEEGEEGEAVEGAEGAPAAETASSEGVASAE